MLISAIALISQGWDNCTKKGLPVIIPEDTMVDAVQKESEENFV